MSTIETELVENLDEFLGFARSRLADPDLAANALQDSLLKALRSRDRINDHGSTRAWFYRILRRTIIDLMRRRAARDRALGKLAMGLADAPTHDEERVACACLRKLIPTLSPQYAELIRRLDLNGETTEAVAASLGVTRTNLTVRLHRARRQLKDRLVQTCRVCTRHGCLDCTCDVAQQNRS